MTLGTLSLDLPEDVKRAIEHWISRMAIALAEDDQRGYVYARETLDRLVTEISRFKPEILDIDPTSDLAHLNW